MVVRATALLLGLILVVPTNIIAQRIPAEVKQVVGFVFVQPEPGKLVANGTGFFVGVKDAQEPTRSYVYFVTAKHVLTQGAGGAFFPEVFLRLNKKDGKTSELARVPLAAAGPTKNVFVHSDGSVDIAVIPAVPDEKTIDFKFLDEDLVTTKTGFSELKIAEGSGVFFTGLFTPYVGAQRNYPIVRFGTVALVTDEKINWGGAMMDLYLMETASYGGNSGSPVFFYLGSDREPGSIIVGPPLLKLAGVMMGAFQDVRPVRVIEQSSTTVSTSNMGIAAVVPAYKLHEILFGPELTKQRQQAPKK